MYQRPISKRDWNLLARVPDHVRNPGRYTVYTLDSPIEVGSGVDGGPELADMERVSFLNELNSIICSNLLQHPCNTRKLLMVGIWIYI